MTVGFQGEPGAFSEEAARALLGECETRGYATFDALVTALDREAIEYALLPCENSIHGPVTRSYDLLLAYPKLHIVDEAVYRIVQTLIGLPGSTPAQIRRIESHPVALEQCRRFLDALENVEIVPVADTAGAVRDVVAAGDPTRAAIGPEASAKRYGGQILAGAVQDEPDNFTRFFLVGRHDVSRRRLGRAAIAFALRHQPGSLHRALGLLAERGLNLRSLVARPQPKRPFEYVFYGELDCPDELQAREIVQALGPPARLLGWY
jgi:prephenate dehydratase